MKISPKKEKELFDAVHEEIMRTRVQVARLLNFNPAGKQIDDLLSDLLRSAPLLAVKVFKPAESPKGKEFPEYKDFCRLWDDRYHEIGFNMPRDGHKIKSIILQTRAYIKKTGHEPTLENVCVFWGAFVQNLHKTWAHGKNLSIIDSNYTALIYELKHGKKPGYNSKPSAQRIIEDLA